MNETATTPQPTVECPSWCTSTVADHIAALVPPGDEPWHTSARRTVSTNEGESVEVYLGKSGDDGVTEVFVGADMLTPDQARELARVLVEVVETATAARP